MKQTFTIRRTLLFLFTALFTMVMRAETVTFNVETPGTLGTLINGWDFSNLNDLKITGKINGDDIAVFNRNNGISNNDLYNYIESLDLSEAQIVAGGAYYKSYSYNEAGQLTSENLIAEDNVIGESMFNNMPKLKKLKLPESAVKIDTRALYYNKLLSEIIVPNNVSEIGDYAFYGCTGLEEVTIGKGVKTIYDFAFLNCLAIKNVSSLSPTPPTCSDKYGNTIIFEDDVCEKATLNVPEGSEENYKTVVGWCNFFTYKQDSLSSITINVEKTGSLGAQLTKTNLTAVTNLKITGAINGDDIAAMFNAGDIYYHKNFYKRLKERLETIDLSEAQIVAGGVYYKYKYYNDKGELADGSYIAEDNVIGNYMFAYMSQLKVVKLPLTATKIDDEAFYYCTGLEEVYNADKIKSFGTSSFGGCTNLKQLTISPSVESIGGYAFYKCNNLQVSSLVFGANTAYIGFKAFSGCTGITNLTITSSNTEIGGKAFETSTLKNITCLSEIPPILHYADDPFTVTSEFKITGPFNAETFRTATLTIPAGTERNYMVQAVDGDEARDQPRALWRAFFTREIDIPESGFIDFCAPFSVKVPEGVTVYRANGKGDYVELTKIDTQIIPAAALNKEDNYCFIGVILYKENGGKVALDFTDEVCPNSIRTEIGKCEDNSDDYHCWPMSKKDIDWTAPMFRFNPTTTQFELITKTYLEPFVDFYMYNCSNYIDINTRPIKFAEGSEPSGIQSVINTTSDTPVSYYSIDGRRLETPQKGINIVHYSNGKTNKVVIK